MKHDLRQRFSRCGLQIPGGAETLSVGPQGQNYFCNNTKTFLLFHCIDICTDRTKHMEGKTSDALI